MRLCGGQVGNFSRVSFSQACGFRSFSLAVPRSDCRCAALWPARSEPMYNQFFFPITTGRMQFSAALLCVPCQGALVQSVKGRPGKLSFQPEALGAAQEVTNGLKHSKKTRR